MSRSVLERLTVAAALVAALVVGTVPLGHSWP
jgi:hypothetical protein